MERREIVQRMREALPASVHGIKLTIALSEDTTNTDHFPRKVSLRTNEQAALFFISEILNDLEAINTRYPGQYKEFLVSIEDIKLDYVKYVKSAIK